MISESTNFYFIKVGIAQPPSNSEISCFLANLLTKNLRDGQPGAAAAERPSGDVACSQRLAALTRLLLLPAGCPLTFFVNRFAKKHEISEFEGGWTRTIKFI